MPLQPEPIPYKSPIEEGGEKRISRDYYLWLFGLTERLGVTAQAVQTFSTTTSQSAAIGATPLIVTNSAGLYRITFYLRIARAATVSSSATVSIVWTDSAVPVTYTAPAVTGNTTTTFQTESLLVRSDGAAPISYAVAYASVGGTTMAYDFSIVCEQVA